MVHHDLYRLHHYI